MIGGLLLAVALQAIPSETAGWRDISAPSDDSPTWIDTTSIRGPRTHRELMLRLIDKPTKGYGYMNIWVDCEGRTFTVTAIRAIDPAGKVVFDKQFGGDDAPRRSFERGDTGFAGYVCA